MAGEDQGFLTIEKLKELFAHAPEWQNLLKYDDSELIQLLASELFKHTSKSPNQICIERFEIFGLLNCEDTSGFKFKWFTEQV